jgi:hypothetical protein
MVKMFGYKFSIADCKANELYLRYVRQLVDLVCATLGVTPFVSGEHHKVGLRS